MTADWQRVAWELSQDPDWRPLKARDVGRHASTPITLSTGWLVVALASNAVLLGWTIGAGYGWGRAVLPVLMHLVLAVAVGRRVRT